MVKLKRYSGSAWVEVPDGGQNLKYFSQGWQIPAKLAYRSATGWETVWSRSTTPVEPPPIEPPTPTLTSDPKTYQHSPTDSDSYRRNGWRSSATIYQASLGFGDHIGCLVFDYAAIKAQLDVRPNVTAARLKIMREDSRHGTIGARLLLWSLAPTAVNTSSKLVKGVQPDLVNATKEVSTNSYDRGEYAWESISTVFIDRFRWESARGFGFAEDETLSRTGGNDPNYAKFEGWTATNKPILEFTCDYDL